MNNLAHPRIRKTRIASITLSFLALLIAISGFGSAGARAATPDQTNDGEASNFPSLIACPGPTPQCFADVLPGSTFFDFANNVYTYEIVTGYACGGAGEPCDAQNRPYYRPNAAVTRGQMSKFTDNARSLPGLSITSDDFVDPIYVHTTANSGSGLVATATGSQGVGIDSDSSGAQGTGVLGTSSGEQSVGVYGTAAGNQSIAVRGYGSGTNVTGVDGVAFGPSGSQIGVRGTSANGYGVAGYATAGGYGVYGTSVSGFAGYFQGNVEVTGTCCAMGLGITRIDNPLDPSNKYLNQSLMQSPDMLSVLNGNITTGANGDALVALPAYFVAANKDFRYQLTPIGRFAQAIVSQEVQGNSFTIKTDKPNVKVSWQVTGVRSDPYAAAHPLQAEQAKSAEDQGKYLQPEVYGQPESSGIGYDDPATRLPILTPHGGSDRK